MRTKPGTDAGDASGISDGKTLTNIGGLELRLVTGQDNSPALHDGKAIGQFPQKIEIRLDEEEFAQRPGGRDRGAMVRGLTIVALDDALRKARGICG